jgi:hypothetical protein
MHIKRSASRRFVAQTAENGPSLLLPNASPLILYLSLSPNSFAANSKQFLFDWERKRRITPGGRIESTGIVASFPSVTCSPSPFRLHLSSEIVPFCFLFLYVSLSTHVRLVHKLSTKSGVPAAQRQTQQTFSESLICDCPLRTDLRSGQTVNRQTPSEISFSPGSSLGSLGFRNFSSGLLDMKWSDHRIP